VTAGDTAAVPLGFGGFNSRQAAIAGPSAHAAALLVKTKVLAIASHLMEAGEQDLEIEGREVRVKGVPGMKLGLQEIARAAAGIPGYKLPGGLPPGLEATEQIVIDNMTYANGTAVAEVEVDIETGEVALREFVFVHDCGEVIHPKIVDGQVLGGIAHGIGNALFEQMGYDGNAQPVTTNLAEYLLITSTEMPRIHLLHEHSPSPLNVLGVKGVGESGVLPTAAAIVSAIDDALSPFGVRIARVPVSPQHIAELIDAAQSRRA
jgi:aerobic carbon-monoxide dehydrogenase large subunit